MGTSISKIKRGHALAFNDAQRDQIPEATHGGGIIRYERTLSVPVPVELLEHHRLVGAPGRGQLWDRFCVLRTRVLQTMVKHGWKSMGITSATRGEGKTWTAVNLAISIARRVGNSALLVDANLRRPTVHRHFGFDGQHGLGSHLLYDTPVEKILIHPKIGNISILPAGSMLRYSSDFFSSPRMSKLSRELKRRYADRFVIFDLPAIEDGDDVLSMLPHMDAILLVVEEGTSRDALARACEKIHDIPLVGTVLNKGEKGSD